MAKFSLDPQKTVNYILVLGLIFFVIGQFITGSIHYDSTLGKWAWDFSLSTPSSASSILYAALLAGTAYIIMNYIWKIGEVNNRTAYFKIIVIGVLLYLVYYYLFGPEGIFKNWDILKGITNSIIKP